ncbi:hypothetical protein GCM10020331_007400 [Ectobacillus funiculus]
MERQYEISNYALTLEEYKYLCSVVGWEDYMNLEVAEISLKKFRFFAVTVKDRSKVIGMGRIVGDGAIYFLYSRRSSSSRLPRNGYW